MRRYQRVHEEVQEYEVLARKERKEALRMIGSVVAPDGDLAAAYARATYDEERWIEIVIVPSKALYTLWGPGEETPL